MKHTIYYRDLDGRNTKDVLRKLSTIDEEYLKRVFTAYKLLYDAEPRADFRTWYDQPNKQLPRQPRMNNQHNSPRTFVDGIIDKLSQAKNRRDLSPRQCDGIEVLSSQIEQMYDENLCANIEFAEEAQRHVKQTKILGALFA
jgi:hypothetical protein